MPKNIMQTNNLLYQQSIGFVKRQDFVDLYSGDIKSLKDTGYVVSTINIDRTLSAPPRAPH